MNKYEEKEINEFDDAFEGKESSFVICGLEGSYAESYAKSKNIKFATGNNIKEAKCNQILNSVEVSDKVLNICVWNDEFARRLSDYYPGYIANDEDDATKGGYIGDVKVNFIVIPSDNNSYQDTLDVLIDKIDMFLVEPDYALKYIETDNALPISELGITDEELSKQYQYTKDVVTDSKGVIKGVTWQTCAGALIYNREVARNVLGSDDPSVVQQSVSDWDKYNETAKELKKSGYKMTATTNDTYRVFSDNVTTSWTKDALSNVNIDTNIEKWAKLMKDQVDSGITGVGVLWGDTWREGLYPDGKVFCYFGPAWMVDFSMAEDESSSIAADGGWAACEGPQGFYWGGTWFCAAKNTDNKEVIADIIRKLTIDDEIMTSISKVSGDQVNNMTVMEQLADDSSIGDKVLGGQNALGVYNANAKKIRKNHCTLYDAYCSEQFQSIMNEYFEGNPDTYEKAVDIFKELTTGKKEGPNDNKAVPEDKEEQKPPVTTDGSNQNPPSPSGGTDQGTSGQTDTVVKPAETGSVLEVESTSASFKVTSSDTSEPTVAYKAMTNKKAKTVTIPQTVVIDNVEYKVTSIESKAFSGNKKITKVTIGNNIIKVGAGAFSGCKNLKTITIKSTKLTKKSFGKNAFKGISKKATITVPKKQYKNYKKWLKNAGLPKGVKIKKK